MSFVVLTSLTAIGLFLFVMLGLEGGRRLGAERQRLDPQGGRAGLGPVEGAIFGLLGLLIAFTLSGALTRFEDRRALVTKEANAIGTAWLRIELLPDEFRPPLRDLFRRYLDSRIETYRRLPDLDGALQELARSATLQGEIWTTAVAGVRAAPTPVSAQILPALNEMIDITSTRLAAAKAHPPWIVFGMLFALVVTSAFMAGYGMAEGRTRSWLHMIGFALAMSLTVFVILNVEFPRLGLFRLDSTDQMLVDLRQSLK